MKTKILLILSLLISSEAFAQALSSKDLMILGEIQHHKGYVPKGLVSLVASSSLIVKGRFREHLKNDLFFGYVDGQDDTLEEFMRRHKLEDRVDAYNWAIPLSEYEISVDEVLLGKIDSNPIVFRKYEAPPTDRALTNPNIDRIFFLVLNPDMKTYAVRGDASILSEENGEYFYSEFVIDSSIPNDYVKRRLGFLPNMTADEFESVLKEEIARQADAAL